MCGGVAGTTADHEVNVTPSLYRPRKPKPAVQPQVHDFSSTQVPIQGRASEIARKMQNQIQPSDLGPEGKENEHHVTVKYGIAFQTPTQRMRQALRQFGPVQATLGKTSIFENPDADVLKVDVHSPDLNRLHKAISKLAPTKDTHPVYQPHLTLAYLKPGKGKKYVGDSSLEGHQLTFSHVQFSGKRGHQERMPLGDPGPQPYRVR
jgi:2'-5' RNA ligase